MPHEPIHQLFRCTAERHGVATAIESRERRVSYSELEARANDLANFLLASGVPKGAAVALLADDSVEVVTALLAVLKAGGVFMPLDPRLPERRLAEMLEQVSPQWFLVEPQLYGRLPAFSARGSVPVKVIPLGPGEIVPSDDSTIEVLDGLKTFSDPRPVDVPRPPDDACYVVFTSGSTGKPKGIVGRLKAIDHFIRWEVDALGLDETVRVSQLTTPAFDAFLRDVFVPLTLGGTLCVPPGRETVLDAGKLAVWIDERRIHLVHCVPSLFRTLLNEPLRPELFTALRHVLLAGEPFLPADARRWMEVFGERVQLVNLYGPSETTMTKFAYFLQRGDGSRSSIPIGRPIVGATAILLDENGKICPRKTVGEIYIRTPFRSLGYFGRSDLTSEAFIPNPFSTDPEDLIYRTGDLARVLDDGNFEFLGRRDQQVKIRGMRVELTEVTNALRSCPAVGDAATLGREDGNGNMVLCAYVVANGDGAELEPLRHFLLERLPDYMVPTHVVLLDELPRTVTGKVDLKVLPEPTDLAVKTPYAEPRTATEELIAGIWQQVLGVERVGAKDDFFALGGHSLMATRIVSRLSQTFAVDLPLSDLFEEPQVSALARRVEAAQRRGQARQTPPVTAVTRERDLPLSFAQERLWILDCLDPGRPTYNIPIFLALNGAVDLVALEKSLCGVVDRHESLRSAFPVRRGQPVQTILPPRGLAFLHIDLRVLETGRRGPELERLARAAAVRPFDLASGPLVRASLVRVEPGRWALLLVVHHIAVDNWSIGLLVRDLGALYEAFSARRAPRLPALAVQYADFAVWQREWLRGEILEAHLSYWRQQLAGLPVLELPADRPRPAVQRGRGARLGTAFPGGLGEALKALSQERQVTLFMTLLAAFAVLLERYTGQSDVPVGTPIANRNQAELEDVVGFFVNTLVMRSDLSADPRFPELLEATRRMALAAHAHQDLPFEKLVEALQPHRDLSRQALFQVMFVYQNAPQTSLELTGVHLDQLASKVTTAAFDLTMVATGAGQGEHLLVAIDYDTDLFAAETIRRMLGHYRVLLGSIADDPGQRISRLPMLSAAQRHQLLAEWGARGADASGPATLGALFASQAGRTPDAVAVVCDGQCSTYGELDRRAGRLAQVLEQRGVGPESVVGLAVERSLTMVVAILGVIEAGGAYLPLDPALPKERIRWILEDAGAKVVLTQGHLQARLGTATATFLLDEAPPVADACSSDPGAVRRSVAEPDHLAYVIYTSGSTGRPKGVMVPHRSVCSTLAWRRRAFSLGPDERILQNIPITFDPSLWQIFGALANGGRLVLVPSERHKDADDLGRLMAAERITITDFPPSLLKVLLEAGALDSDPALKRIFAGGEALPAEVRDRYLSHLAAELHNIYGPTEAAIDTACWTCQPEASAARVPIGRPIDSKNVALLDARLRPVPVGVVGELCVGGPGLARGYLARAAQTAASFIPDPFVGEPGARLYRTGDLVRYRADGLLEFLRRADDQVKIRGLRIEPGEIEMVLTEHREVDEAAVCVRLDASGEKRLVAYVVAPCLVPADLKELLARKVPSYMVPEAFIILERLPRNPSGKVDRAALPDPDWNDAGKGYVAPRTSFEEIVAKVFAEVLRRERVGAEDSFFDLGGHSILATKAVARLRAVCGVELAMRELFEAPEVARLARRIEAARQEGATALPPIVAIPRDGGRDRFPLSFPQQRLWFLDRLEPGNPAYNVHDAYHLAGHLDVAALVRGLNKMVRRHEVLRAVFRFEGDDTFQMIVAFRPFAVPRVSLRGLPASAAAAELRRLVAADALQPFDLTCGPLYRFRLIDLPADQHALLINFHHIVSDAWSMGIFFQELKALYSAFCADHEARTVRSPLADLAVQYTDFAVWQREWLGDEVLEEQLSYWRRQLAGAPQALALPTDRPRPAVQTFRGARLGLALSPPLTAALHELAREQQATLFMALLAAFCTLLHRWTGQHDLLVGASIANRDRAEIQGLIGFFVNTLVLRTGLSQPSTFRELLGRVRGVTLGAFAHADIPFEKIVEELEPERDLSRSPLVQVMIDLIDTSTVTETLARTPVTHLGVKSRTTKFDLNLSMADSGERLYGSLVYNTDLFDGSTVQRMAYQFEELLAFFAADPDRQLVECALLSAAERHQTLVEWNDTRVAELEPETTLHALFAAQVERSPDTVAVVFEDRALTYRELSSRAGRLADHLRTLGISAGAQVGVCMERSLEMVVSLLGILHAGGAYVPFDPEYPQQRLAFMLVDAGVPVLLTQDELHARLPSTDGVQVVCLNAEETRVLDRRSPQWSSSRPGADSLAYVIYTSGSTGRPKGVMVSHRAIVNRLLWMQAAYRLTPADRVLQKTPFSFDVSVWEFFWPLLTGAKLIVARSGGHRDGAYLSSLIATREGTTLHFVPSMLQMFLEEPGLDRCCSLKRVIASGEALSYELAQRCLARLGAELHNLYGPTEAAVDVTFWTCRRDGMRHWVPIGRPIANMTTYVLDSHGRPAVLGVPGELCLGGVGLARGYLGRPGLTAERFVSDPYGGEPGARLYRTGDLARWRPVGEIEFLGRLDHQVKVRGFRIELGEIEAALGEHPAVREAVVLAPRDRTGESRLVAFVVPEGDEVPGRGDLARFLAARLPQHMMPAGYVALAAVPLTPNGKADRAALARRVPDVVAPRDPGEGATPRDRLELQLLQLWEEILGVKPGLRQSFFELGGHSLLALRLMVRIEKRFGVRLPLAMIFQTATIEELAAVLSQRQEVAPPSPLVAIQPNGSRRPFFCVHPAGGHTLCYVPLAHCLGWDQPFYGLQDPSCYGVGEPSFAVEEVAAQYVAEIRRAQPEGPYLLGGWSLGGTVVFEMARQLHVSGAEVRLLAILDSPAPGSPQESSEDEQEVGLALWFARQLGLPISAEELLGQPQEERLGRVLAAARKLDRLPPEIGPQEARRIFLIYQSEMQAERDYRPAVYPGRIVLFRAAEHLEETDDPTLGWDRLATGGVDLRITPGTHHTIVHEPHVRALAELLREEIDRVSSSGANAKGS